MAIGTPILIVGLIWLAAAITLLILGGVRLGRERKAVGGGFIAAGLLMVLVAAGSLALALKDSDKEDTVTVFGLDQDTDPRFTVDIKHYIGWAAAPGYYDFWAAGSQEQVLAAFESQHPDGERTLPNTDQAKLLPESLWHLSTDTMRYELLPGANSDGFAVIAQVATLESAEGNGVVRIPYPATKFGFDVYEVTTYGSDWTAEDWRAFYADIGLATIDGDTITLPTDTDATVTVTLIGDDAKFHINP